MAYILTPSTPDEEVATLHGFLHALERWQSKHALDAGEGYLSQLWYRGVNAPYPDQRPGVFRDDFTKSARALTLGKTRTEEEKRLHLERELLSQFRTAGAVFLGGQDETEIYFATQHHRMPTRLLDWSTNPLSALFFACDGAKERDGFVYAMDARKIVRDDAKQANGERLYQAVMTMRHPYVRYAVGLSFWNKPRPDHPAHILPVRPDLVSGRIGQQSSVFTLHMHEAKSAENPTMGTILVKAKAKPELRRELHRLNVNQFTTYYDLDHLSEEIKRRWGITES